MQTGDWILLSGVAMGAVPPLLLLRRPILGVDAPEGQARKLQATAIPLAGAATLGLSALLHAGSALREGSNVPLAFLGAVLLTLALGITDDRRPRGLAALPKLFGQGLIGAIVGVALLESQGLPIGIDSQSILFLLGATFVVMLLQNAWNFFDNFDGAAVWVASTSCLLILSGQLQSAGPGPLSSGIVLQTALIWGLPLLGFAYWNYPRARCYLGDAGSHLLGLGFAYMSLQGGLHWRTLERSLAETTQLLDLRDLSLLLVATSALPLVDLVQVSIVRLLHGIPPWQGDRRHLAHRLASFLPHAAVAPALAALHVALVLLSIWAAAR